MPYQPVSIPYRGLNLDSGYSSLPAGFTSACLNVMPYDAFKGKLRIGQRRPLLGAIEVNDESPAVTRKVQAIVRADAYIGSPATLTQRCIIVAGGDVFIIDRGQTTATKLARDAGLAAMTATGHIGVAVFGQFCYFADGTFYRKIDITQSTPTVVDWSGSHSPYNYVRTGTNPNYKYANLLCRFGGRLALSGLVDAPNTWFLSKLNDADHWDPLAAANTDSAIAGASSTRFGTPGAPIVSLIPVGESGLMFGCRNSMVYLTGDPVLADARLIELSRSVGIVSANAWCNTDSQTVCVMSPDGFYRIRPNDFQITQADRVSGNRLDSFFQSQSISSLDCSLGYDRETKNVYINLSRTDIPDASRHLVYNLPTDSFWVWQTGWGTFRAPTCCGEFPSGDSRGSILAFGTETGYIGWFDRNLTSGVDGQAATNYKAINLNPTTAQAETNRIQSQLILGPVLNPTLGQVMMRDVRIELTMDEVIEDPDFDGVLSGPFADILAGQTAEEAIGENVVAVQVSYDLDRPALVRDGGGPSTDYTGAPTYDCGNADQAWSTSTDKSLDLFYEQEIASYRYLTLDTLITDPTARTYVYGKNRVVNGDSSPSTNWLIQHTNGTPQTMMQRDETFPNTSADTPGGTYKYYSAEVAAGFALPADIFAEAPRVVVTSSTYVNTNLLELGELLPGRNDALRCRVRDQAAYVQVRSFGVPWALERMSVLIDPVTHTKNVKGTY